MLRYASQGGGKTGNHKTLRGLHRGGQGFWVTKGNRDQANEVNTLVPKIAARAKHRTTDMLSHCLTCSTKHNQN
jgi:hypothetical protein